MTTHAEFRRRLRSFSAAVARGVLRAISSPEHRAPGSVGEP